MILFDIVLVSNAATQENRLITKNCIDSILCSQDENFSFNIIVVEQQPSIEYHNVLTLHYDFDFNYNRCLNLGLSHSFSKYKGICNNDLIFHSGWSYGIYNALNDGYGSASPYCPKFHPKIFPIGDGVVEGYKIRREVAGWAIFLTDETLHKIGKINDGVSFWFSDNIYIEQLKREKIKHCLVTNSFVSHIESFTLNKTNRAMYDRLTVKQQRAFENEMKKIWKGRVNDVYNTNTSVSNNNFINLKTNVDGKKKEGSV